MIHIGMYKKVAFEKIMKKISKDGIDLLEKLLEIDYEKRITAEAALKHPYFSEYHSEADEVLIKIYFNSQFVNRFQIKNSSSNYTNSQLNN